MSFNPGPLICSTTAAVIHNQRVNKSNKEEVSSSSERFKAITNYEEITSPKDILEELKLVLEQGINKDANSISVYNVINLVRNKCHECQSLDRNLYYRISALTGLDYLFLDIDYDYQNRYLIVSYHGNKMFFTKQNNDLILVKSESHNAKNILGKCGKEISERYDKFIEDVSFYRDYMNSVQSTNSNFKINSDEYCVNVTYSTLFKLSAKIYKNEYEYDCNSNNICSVCRNREDELFKRIFIKIDDCPEWTHEILYEIRKKQLEKQEKTEYKEIKKQKRLDLIRKLIPFRKE